MFEENNLEKTLKPGNVVGQYKVLDKFYGTNMSEVYEVFDSETKEEKMLKTYKGLDVLVSERFSEEIRITRKLDGMEGIIKSYDPVIVNGKLCLPLEKLEKELFDYLNKKIIYKKIFNKFFKKKDFFEKLGVFMEKMSSVLCYFKKEGIVHRDIKPGNIMTNKKDQFTLLDFGLAYDLVRNTESKEEAKQVLKELYLMDPSKVKKSPSGIDLPQGFVYGTPGFIAPELFSQSLPLPSSDVYSFGKTIMKAILEKFNTKKASQLFPSGIPSNIQCIADFSYSTEWFVRIVKSSVSLPNSLDTILYKTLEKEPKNRLTPEELKELSKEYMRGL